MRNIQRWNTMDWLFYLFCMRWLKAQPLADSVDVLLSLNLASAKAANFACSISLSRVIPCHWPCLEFNIEPCTAKPRLQYVFYSLMKIVYACDMAHRSLQMPHTSFAAQAYLVAYTHLTLISNHTHNEDIAPFLSPPLPPTIHCNSIKDIAYFLRSASDPFPRVFPVFAHFIRSIWSQNFLPYAFYFGYDYSGTRYFSPTIISKVKFETYFIRFQFQIRCSDR